MVIDTNGGLAFLSANVGGIMLAGNILKSLREDAGLKLSEIEGINASYLSTVECGHVVPKLETLARIVGAYGYELRVVACKSNKSGELVRYLWG